MIHFKDNFSNQADIYARYRPYYPKALYAYLSSLTEKHDLAWDCGTGNGQAASALADCYKNVIATDPSEKQISHAISKPNVTYLLEKAEHNSIPSNSVDLLTIANALHWFDFDLFYSEANRVLKKDGVIAAWAYALPVVSPEIDALVHHFHYQTLGDYWLEENRLVEREYGTIPFPFKRLITPEFYAEKKMNLDDFIGYLNTWSATQRFIKENKINPTLNLKTDLADLYWINAVEEKNVRWKLTLLAGMT